MKHKTWIILFGLVVCGLFFTLVSPAQGSPVQQAAYQTPTALPDGRVLYKVQAGDSCLRIELLTGVKVQRLLELNKLDQSCTLQTNQELLLAVITPTVTPTLNPLITATPLLPTPTILPGTGEICVVLFADTNGSAVREDTEPPILGGAVSVTDRSGAISKTGLTTDKPEPFCFKELPEGDYNISMAVPDGYNPTTTINYPLKLIAGNRSIIDFGAQISSRPANPGGPAPSSNSPLLAILGGVLILGGIGLGVYLRIMKK